MYFRNESIDTILKICGLAINNSLDNNNILTETSRFGYDRKKMLEGEQLLQKAEGTRLAQIREHNEKESATRHFKAQFDATHTYTMELVEFARRLLGDTLDKYQQLGLNGRRSIKYAPWVQQTRQFYQEALGDAEVLRIFRTRNITPDELRTGLEMLEDTIAAFNTQQEESAEAQHSTEVQVEIIDELYEWVDDYLTIAEIALKDKPQLMETLGVFVRS